MDFTKEELALMVLSVGRHAKPKEYYLNELAQNETAELAFAAYLTGSLQKTLKIAKTANSILTKLAKADRCYGGIEDVLEELKCNAKIYDDWEQQIKRWDEVTNDAVKN